MKVAFFGSVQEYANGEKSFEADDVGSIRDLVDLLGERFGERFRNFLLGDNTCIFLLNGKSAMMAGGLGAPLAPGDTVDVLPFVDGG